MLVIIALSNWSNHFKLMCVSDLLLLCKYNKYLAQPDRPASSAKCKRTFFHWSHSCLIVNVNFYWMLTTFIFSKEFMISLREVTVHCWLRVKTHTIKSKENIRPFFVFKVRHHILFFLYWVISDYRNTVRFQQPYRWINSLATCFSVCLLC